MYAQAQTLTPSRSSGADSHGPDRTKPVATKEYWLQKYTARIFNQFLRGGTPLGIASACTVKVKNDLAKLYDDPLKRMFIEATY